MGLVTSAAMPARIVPLLLESVSVAAHLEDGTFHVDDSDAHIDGQVPAVRLLTSNVSGLQLGQQAQTNLTQHNRAQHASTQAHHASNSTAQQARCIHSTTGQTSYCTA